MNEKDFAELAAGHALHALSADDERAYTEALAAHPEWQHIATTDASTAASLADSVLDVSPPEALRADLLARIALTPQGGPTVDDEGAEDAASDVPDEPAAPAAPASPRAPAEPALDTATVQTIARRTWTRGLFGLAASLVLLLALGFGAVAIGQQIATPAAVVALHQIQDAPDSFAVSAALEGGGDATAHWSESLGKAVLVTNGLPQIETGHAFELWFIRDETPVSAGVFTAGPEGGATALLDGTMKPGDVIAVTVEEKGGSATGEPTTPPILLIPTA